MDEFLKLKTNPNISATIKRKEVQKKNFDLILSSPPQQPQQQQQKPQAMIQTNSALATTPKTVSLQDLKFLSPNKCFVPITIKDAGNDQRQIVAQFDTKNLVLPTAYLQMKIQPQQQIATIDGQHIVQLTAGNLPNTISISPQQNQTIQAQLRQQTSNAQLISSASSTLSSIPSDTKCIFTTSSGQNVTITHQPLQSISGNAQQQQSNQSTVQHQFLQPLPPLTPASSTQTNAIETAVGKIQLTTLQNVSTNNITHPLPQKSGITIQRIKQENRKLPTTKTVTSPPSAPVVQVSSTTSTFATKSTTTTTTTARKANNKPNQIQANANNENNKSGSGNEAVPTCEVCEKVFKRKEHLAQHMKLHLGLRYVLLINSVFNCEVQNLNLINLLRPFKCEEVNCNKAFSRKEHLMRHVISHTGKKMFSCEFCHKLFSRKDNLNKHRR